jgi:hypothetical protein
MREGATTIALMCALLTSMGAGVARAQPRPAPTAKAAPAPAAAPASAPAPKPLAETLTGDAKSDYDAGKLLVGDGDFAGAEVKFRSAYDRSSDPRLLWNVAACEKGQRHYARTLALVKQYLATGGAVLTDADRAEARALVDTIETLTVKLTLAVSEPGADVTVDDQSVGTSPLPAPLVVDIGSRKIGVKKAGFKDFTQTVPVGGSAEVRIDVTLLPEVHEGQLTVTTAPGATIFIDGQSVGVGRYAGKLRSGGHTLRVEAQGMHPYQSDVSIADDENRSIDVPLERQQDVPLPPPEHGPTFIVGVQYGPGIKLNGDNPWEQMVRLDVAWRPRYLDLGLLFEAGSLDASGLCGTNVHGPAPSSPTDIAVRYSYSSCKYLKAGFVFAVHVLPAHAFDPWIAFEPAFRLGFYTYRQYDPLGEQPTSTVDSSPTPALDLGLRIGLDWHPVDTYRAWAFGPYAGLVYTPVAEEDPPHATGGSNGQGNGDLQPPSNDGDGPAHYLSIVFGLRTSLSY